MIKWKKDFPWFKDLEDLLSAISTCRPLVDTLWIPNNFNLGIFYIEKSAVKSKTSLWNFYARIIGEVKRSETYYATWNALRTRVGLPDFVRIIARKR